VLLDERDDLSVAFRGLEIVTAGLMDHAEAIIAVVRFRELDQEIVGGLFGLIELAGTNEIGSGVGRDGEYVLVSVHGAGESRRDGRSHFTKVNAMCGGAFCAPRDLHARGIESISPPARWTNSELIQGRQLRRPHFDHFSARLLQYHETSLFLQPVISPASVHSA